MQTNSKRNSGLAASFHMSPVVTFEVTRTAGGRFSRVVGPDLPAPRHSSTRVDTTAVELPLLPE